MVTGAQQPRIALIPEGSEHPKWSEVVDFVAALDITLDDWQWLVLRSSLLRSGDYWAAFSVAVCAPRQNGKNGILEIRELIGPVILGEKLAIHTAHLADTSKEGFRRLDDLIDEHEWLSKQVKHIWRTNGHESIEFKGGRRIRFRTRTRGGGRGFSGSPVIFDEAMFLPEVSMGAILPVISAQPDPQVWYMGSAVDQAIMEDGVVFARVRERALEGKDKRLAYFEWSLDAEVPTDVTPEQIVDPAVWAATNPAYGIRITEDYIRAEAGELDERTFAVERLGVGDWPDTSASASHVISLDKWLAIADQASVLKDPVTFAFDVAPDRSVTSIAAAGKRADGIPHVELVERKRGTRWVADRLVELTTAHDASAVVCDASGPAASLLVELESLGLEVYAISAREHAAACGLFYDLVEQENLRHLGSPEMQQALKGAAKRSLGEAWAWSRRNSAVDISPLVASTLAVWASSALRKPEAEMLFAFG